MIRDVSGEDLSPLLALLAGRRFVALTGAGCSTESGIPDYRGGGRTGPQNPIQHDGFLRREDVRRRYWARATLGWARFSGAAPNAAHRALAALEEAGPLAGVITQNVDRLHHRAGSRRVVELHGAIAEVLCLRCGEREGRASVQARLLRVNPGWLERTAAIRPDGDADLDPARGAKAATPPQPIAGGAEPSEGSDPEDVSGFQVVGCRVCGGDLKPDVVFFGGSVAEPTLAAAWDLFDCAEALLVVGSSLTVYSGFRFVRRARERGVPVAVVNIGPTRADDMVQAKLSAPAAEVLPRLARALKIDMLPP
jgi:NAD-dependent protein deacetylase/lipoamidase sirtuin 4